MFAPNGWFATARAILELLYFASGIVIALAAIFALKQIQLTKRIAKTNARRESVRMAADLCKYFAEVVVPASGKVDTEYKTLKLRFLDGIRQERSPHLVRDGEIVNENFNFNLIGEEFPKVAQPVVTHLNYMEAFAIPFVAGVADETIGYQETARTFCYSVARYLPLLSMLRSGKRGGRYESAVRLFETWSKRLAAEDAAPIMNAMAKLAVDAKKERIKPLGEDL